jgi:O-antigen/teichoic acid export membrane protein
MPRGTGSRVRSVVRNSAVLAVSRLLERASGFVVGVLVANRLGADGLGVYAVAWAVYGIVAVAGVAGTTDYLVREISRDASRTASYTVHLGVIAIAFSAVLMLITQVVVRHVGYSPELEASVSVMLLAILPKVVNAIQEGVFVAHGRVAYQTLTRFWSASGYVALSAWMLAHGADVASLVRAFVAMEYGVTVVYLVLIHRNIARLRPVFGWTLARRLAGELKAFTASSVIASLFARPEIVLLSLMATEREAGIYSAAVRIAELPLMLIEVLMINVFPLLSETYQSAEDRFAAWQTAAARVVLATSLLFAASCVALGDEIVRLLYGDDLADAAPVLVIVGVNVVFFAQLSVFWRSLVARGRQAVNLQLQTFSVAVRLASGVALIAPFAAMGAAISSGLSSVVHLALLVRATGRSGAPVNLLRMGVPFALAAAAAAAAMWLSARWLPVPVAVVAGCLVYGALVYRLGAVTAGDRLLLEPLSRRFSRRPTARTP